MLLNAKELLGFGLRARDEIVGTINDFYFDDDAWIVKYAVVKGAGRLSNRNILISVQTLEEPEKDKKVILTRLDADRILRSPDMDMDNPISINYEMKLARYYEWPVYPSPAHEIPRPGALAKESMTAVVEDEKESRQLLAFSEILRYRATAGGVEIGRVTDLRIDDLYWYIRYFVVTLTKESAGSRILVSPDWVNKPIPEREELAVGLSADNIRGNATYDVLDYSR